MKKEETLCHSCWHLFNSASLSVSRWANAHWLPPCPRPQCAMQVNIIQRRSMYMDLNRPIWAWSTCILEDRFILVGLNFSSLLERQCISLRKRPEATILSEQLEKLEVHSQQIQTVGDKCNSCVLSCDHQREHWHSVRGQLSLSPQSSQVLFVDRFP